MKTQHTLGPWSCGDSFDVISCRFDEMPIVAKIRPVDSKSEREANARLIASAPDLLEALLDAKNRLFGAGMLGGSDDLVNSAIAKATGNL